MANENGTVTISLEEFDNLRNFKREIEAGHLVYYYNRYFSNEYMVYYPKDEAIEKIAYENRELEKENRLLKQIQKGELFCVRKMSIWQFLKWRKK